jgi:hypothetical protein
MVTWGPLALLARRLGLVGLPAPSSSDSPYDRLHGDPTMTLHQVAGMSCTCV